MLAWRIWGTKEANVNSEFTGTVRKLSVDYETGA